jgi:peptide/nickel transport system substrate-binding protein
MVSYQSVKSVEIDPKEPEWVVINLTRPEAFLIADLGNVSLRHPTSEQIGTGPYKLESMSPKVRLTAFDKYYRGRPQIAAIEINNFGEQRASWAALMRGEIDAVHEIAPNAVDFMQAEGQTAVNTYSFVRPYYIQLLFNVRHPGLKNPAVRQALSYGVDRQQIVDLALNKQGMIADGPIWRYHWAYSSAHKVYTHNSDSATLRLDSAGLKVKPSAVKGRMPSRLHLRCLTIANDARYERIALVLQKQLYEIGVDLEIETAPGMEVVKRLNSGDFDTVLIQRTTGRSLAWTYLTFHSSHNKAGYKATDTLLDKLRQTTDEGVIRTAVSDLQQVFHDDPPAIFMAWPKVARVVSSRFQVPPDESDRQDDPGRDVLGSLWLWRPAEPAR